jgi:hypothetical protein
MQATLGDIMANIEADAAIEDARSCQPNFVLVGCVA